MKKRFLFLILAAPLLAAPASAQTATLVKDIRPGSSSSYGESFSPGDITAYKNGIFFRASEQSTGSELWSDDGTGTGPRLLADFCPGECHSSPRILGITRSLLFGLAVDEDSNRSTLWRTDGTRQGTFLLPPPVFDVYIPYDRFDEVPPPVVLARDAVYFNGCRSYDDCSLWRSDGTLAGTQALDPLPGSVGPEPLELAAAGSRIFFTTYKKLWVSDGTVAGTVEVKEFAGETPRRLTALGSKVFFLAGDPSAELWVSDGTPAGTRPLTAFEPERPFQQTSFLKALDGRIYFVADDVVHGAELWASDGTAQGTVRITEFGFHDPFGAEDYDDRGLQPDSLVKVGQRVFFVATDGLAGFKIWSTTGTPASTSQVCPSCAFYTDQQARLVLLKNGQIVFRGFIPEAYQGELWTTDGTAAGTRIVKEICPGNCGGLRGEITEHAGRIYFNGQGDLYDALWSSDGTAAGTRQIADVSATVRRRDARLELATRGGIVYFQAWDGAEAREDLWTTDGTRAGARRASASQDGGASAGVSSLLPVGDRVYFTACEPEVGRLIWSSEGTEQTTRRTQVGVGSCDYDELDLLTAGGRMFVIKDRDFSDRNLWRLEEDGQATLLTDFTYNDRLTGVTVFKNQIYLSVDRNNGSEIWRSDGTPQGTVRAFDLPAGMRSVKYLKSAGSYLWFFGEDEQFQSAIWRSDGTTAGTAPVLSNINRQDLDPEFIELGGRVYFISPTVWNDPDYGIEVWRTDGSNASRVTHVPLPVNVRFHPAELTVFQGSLYFFGTSDQDRRGLWKSDGTTAGTVLLKDFPLPADLSFWDIPRYGLTASSSMLVFAIDDGVHGREPWRSDGTAAGTILLRDVFPGPSGSEPGGFTAAGGPLYFSANDGTHGFELWRTDGSPAGTRMVQDLNPEGPSSYPSSFAFAAGRLFFGANDGVSGHELWALPLSGPPCQPSDKVFCLNNGRFKVEAAWRTSESSGPGYARALTADTGYFFFFDDDNVEVVLKVLDGQGINGHFWVYYGALSNVEYTLTVTDTQTGLARRYFNPQERFASVGDSQAFGPRGAYEVKSIAPPSLAPEVSERLDPAKATGTCVPGATRLCLNQSRFAVEIAWEDFSGTRGVGKAVGLTGDTGYFWFFDDANVETIIKVLDATAVNGKFWVYYGALSDVKYDITVTDTLTGKQKVYKNPKGRFASAGDVGAF